MYIIFTENSDSWHSQELKKSLKRLKRKVQCLSITNISLSTSKHKSFIGIADVTSQLQKCHLDH